MTVDPSATLDALVEKTRALLAGAAGDEPGPFLGEAADGQVRCEVGADGRLTSLTVDPKMARQPLEDICAAILTAVNQAQDQRPAPPDTAPYLAELKQVQEQSVADFRKITQAMTDALNSAAARGGGS